MVWIMMLCHPLLSTPSSSPAITLSHNEQMTPCVFWALWGVEYTALQEYPIQLQGIWHFSKQEVFMAFFWGTYSDYLKLDKHVILGRVWLVEGPVPLVGAPSKVCGWVMFPETCVRPTPSKVQENLRWSAFRQGESYRPHPSHPAGFLRRQWTVSGKGHVQRWIPHSSTACVFSALTKSCSGSAQVAATPGDLQTGSSSSCACLSN